MNFGLSDQPYSEVVRQSQIVVRLIEDEIEPQRDIFIRENKNLAKIEADISSVQQQIQLRYILSRLLWNEQCIKII